MKRRAIAFGAAALGCAALAALTAAGYSARADRRYGELRDVVVAAAAIEPGRPIDAATARRALAVRRVPLDFVPPDALAAPSQAVGLRPAVALGPGSYVTAGALRSAPARSQHRPAIEGSPVEITVTGAGALAAPQAGQARTVDVVVTGEPGPGAGGAPIRVAARDVPLLDLRRGGAEPGLPTGDSWIATLALDRAEALRLIRAESFARSIRLLAG